MIQFWIFLQLFLQFLPISGYHPMAGPPRNPHNLRMLRIADDNRSSPLLFRLGHNLVDARHVWTGGIQNLAPLFPEHSIGPLRLSMGANEYCCAVRHLLRRKHRTGPQGLQPGNHMVIVCDVAQHIHRTLLGAGLRQLHRPAYSVAKPGGFGQDHLHGVSSPKARILTINSSAMRW